MGQQQSKDELLYEQAISGNIEAIKSLRRDGAGLEWTDKEGKTPLIAACTNQELFNVAKSLIELGANVNAYSPGLCNGTPLHFAAKRGLANTVKLLLSHGANALQMNDYGQTPLDVARAKGHTNIIRAMEQYVSLFSGWLRELCGPGILERLAPQLLSRKIWVVVLPCGSRTMQKPNKLELVIYTDPQDAQPRTIVPLWKANFEEPNFNQADSVAVISDISRIPRRWRRKRAIKSCREPRTTRIKLAPLHESEKQHLQHFCNACKGIPQKQVVHPFLPSNSHVPTDLAVAPSISEDDEMGILASLQSAACERLVCRDMHIHIGSIADASVSPGITVNSLEKSSPLYVPEGDTDVSPSVRHESGEDESASSCTICLDGPVEGACIPCGHMVACMSCLNEIESKNWGCPVCRTKINQVVRIYAA